MVTGIRRAALPFYSEISAYDVDFIHSCTHYAIFLNKTAGPNNEFDETM
jgi:hypothetical protein